MIETVICQVCTKDISMYKHAVGPLCFKCTLILKRENAGMTRMARKQYKFEKVTKPVLLKKK